MRAVQKDFEQVTLTGLELGHTAKEKHLHGMPVRSAYRSRSMLWRVSAHIRVPWPHRGLSLRPADLVRIGGLAEMWCELNEPLGLDREHVVSVFARGADDLVIDAPLRRVPIQRAQRVDVHQRVLGECLVTHQPQIANRRIPEKARAYNPSHAVAVPSHADHLVFVPVHDPHQLHAHILRVAHVFRLDEVDRAPHV